MNSDTRKSRLSYLVCAILLAAVIAVAQEPLPGAQPVNVAGHWIISAKNWNGELNTKTVDLKQNGNTITGHFKGPDQSGGLEGSVNGHHIVFRTKTKHPLTFRGQVQGDSVTGTYHVMGQRRRAPRRTHEPGMSAVLANEKGA